MKSMEQLLKDNYHGGVDPDRTPRVIEHLKNIDRLGGCSPQHCKLFLKNLTNIILEEPEAIAGLAEKVYDLHQEAVIIVRNANLHEVNDHRMEAHLFGHGGQVASFIHQRGGDSGWLVEAFNMSEQAADMTLKSEPIYALGSFGKAGEAASGLARETLDPDDKIYWLGRAVEMYDAQFGLRKYVGVREHKHITHHRELAWKGLVRVTKKASQIKRYLSAVVDTAEIYLIDSPKRAAKKLYEAGTKALHAGLNQKYTKRDRRQFLKLCQEYTNRSQEIASGELKDQVHKLHEKAYFHLKNFKRRH
jgi:hypothetical protein